jgi:hypothetical protein
MSGKFHDALYICTRLVCTSIFTTVTANPKWPEIFEAIRENSPTTTPSDRADTIAKVFKLTLYELMHDLMHKQVMGRLAEISMEIECQRRMLPRDHNVFIIHPDDRHKTSEDIDKLVSAEIPREPTDDDNEETREYFIRSRTAIVTHMVHGPCGADNPSECLAKSVQSAA